MGSYSSSPQAKKHRSGAKQMAEPFFDMQELFDINPTIRGPKITVAADGSILAFLQGGRLMRRSEDGGKQWSAVQEMEVGECNVVVDRNTGDILLVDAGDASLWRSFDHGKTWQHEPTNILPNAAGHGGPENSPGNGLASDPGITLQHGDRAGRLLVPVRVQPPAGDNAMKHWPYNYNTSIYSDDGGRTWQASEPVQSGTGEGGLAELSDGRIYYNSRCHMATDHRRRIAWSHDGGERWTDWHVCDTLREVGEPFYYKYGSKPAYGCGAGLTRIPPVTTNGKDVLLFSTPDNPGSTRVRMSVWASFDGATTWTIKRLVFPGPSAYSSITADNQGMVYLLFEIGRSANVGSDIDHHKVILARFNLAWVLEGDSAAS